MATHDYVIDNSTGANVRADINSVLQAILTNNSNSSAPSTTAAYMWWADTTSGTLKIRNSADNAWVELLQLDGTLTLEDGSASTPALSFRDDLNTGVYSSAADTFNVATGGVERMELGATTIFNESGADVDFRIEGDNDAALFFVNAGLDQIGIGTDSPQNRMHMHKGDSDKCVLQFTNSTTGLASGDGFQIGLSSTEQGLINMKESAEIVFKTADTERMRIDSSGNVGIGTTSPNYELQVNDSSGTVSAIQITNTTTGTGASDGLLIYNNGLNALISNEEAGDLRLQTSGSERLRIKNDGLMAFNSNGTVNATYQFDYAPATGGLIVNANAAFTGSSVAIQFRTAPSTTSGNITLTNNGTTTSYGTSSDYRLKENAVAISDGITRLKTLKPYRFNFKSSPATTVDGFFAHEVTAVPEAITGTKDEVDADNNPVYQGIDQSKLVPLLVAAVKELITKVETLEAA